SSPLTPPHQSTLLYFTYFTYPLHLFLLFFFTAPATTEIYTLSLHDALPISKGIRLNRAMPVARHGAPDGAETDVFDRHTTHLSRSEEHTSELQSPYDLVCRLLLEKKKKKKNIHEQKILIKLHQIIKMILIKL